MSSSAPQLKADAGQVAAVFPPLLAKADQLAQTLMMGGHGRRRAGRGEEFWQYRPAQAGDAARAIDWRRSAQSDGHFIREHEWQAAQSVYLWCDRSSSMRFASQEKISTKCDRAAVLSLALSILLMKGAERVALMGGDATPRNSALQLSRLTQTLSKPEQSYSAPDMTACLPQARAVMISDFMAPLDPIETAMALAAERGIRGILYQVLDPVEESFPFKGRTIFEAMDGGRSHETLRAKDLRAPYVERLAERRERLSHLAKAAGWRFGTHTTHASAQSALLWLFQALEGPR